MGDFYNVSASSKDISTLGLPFAFFARPLPAHPQGFPVAFQVRFAHLECVRRRCLCERQAERFQAAF